MALILNQVFSTCCASWTFIYHELEEKKKETESAILQSSAVVEDVENLNRNMDPESKDKLIEGILTQIVGDRAKRDTFLEEACGNRKSEPQK